MSEGWTNLEFYLWTIRNLGVPATTRHDREGRLVMEGPFTRLSPEALARLEDEAERLVSCGTDA